MQADDGACAGHLRKVSAERFKLGVIGLDDLAASMQPQRLGLLAERAEHDAEAAILTQMRRRFDAAAPAVEVRDGRVIQNGERPPQALGRDVDVAVSRQRRRRDEKHLLGLDEAAVGVGDPGVVGHSGLLCRRQYG